MDKQVINRADQEQDKGIAEKIIAYFLETGQGAEFFDGQEFDIADVAVLVQHAIVAVVEIVAFGPVAIWHEADDATDHTDDVVGFPGSGKGLVPTVVLDDKNAHEEKGIDEPKRQRPPERHFQQEIHGYPNCDERQKGVQHLNDCLARIGQLVSFYNGRQLAQQRGVVDWLF